MGIGMVLIFWGVVGLFAAFLGAAVLRRLVRHIARGGDQDSGRLLRAATIFPFACLAWAGAVFVLYAVVNESVFNRDPGIGDSWTCPLPNGYAIEMVDVTDRGWLYNPKTQDPSGLRTPQWQNAVDDVCVLQVAGRYILGGRNCRDYVPDPPPDRVLVLSYFLIDTTTRERTDFPTYGALRSAAARMKIEPHLDRIDVVYSRYRFTWFDLATALGTLGVPLVFAGLLLRWMIRLGRSGVTAPQPA